MCLSFPKKHNIGNGTPRLHSSCPPVCFAKDHLRLQSIQGLTRLELLVKSNQGLTAGHWTAQLPKLTFGDALHHLYGEIGDWFSLGFTTSSYRRSIVVCHMLTHLDLPPCQCHVGHRGTFTMSISVITAKSVQSSVTPDSTAAMININGIMPTNCLPSITYHASTLAAPQAAWKHGAKIRAPLPCCEWGIRS